MSELLKIPLEWEIYRRNHPMTQSLGDRQNGAFVIGPRSLKVLVSNGEGWEHASVSTPTRTPTWDEMEWVKRKLWDASATVVQLHVPATDHVNCHPYCLHLWRPTAVEIPRPPSFMVGP